ncbi:Zn finger protein [Squirrelpox virus]|uniref:C7L n=1 Tax=Squirrelpox virus TaxID=240426 RepID=Q1HTQ6_9POXV|nr:Zn finger protein [Squirrelpox virus]ABD51480.1 C7L [Squirrelpox virus]CCD83312.1 Zn finger protein [Squirrelpox virus]
MGSSRNCECSRLRVTPGLLEYVRGELTYRDLKLVSFMLRDNGVLDDRLEWLCGMERAGCMLVRALRVAERTDVLIEFDLDRERVVPKCPLAFVHKYDRSLVLIDENTSLVELRQMELLCGVRARFDTFMDLAAYLERAGRLSAGHVTVLVSALKAVGRWDLVAVAETGAEESAGEDVDG